MQKKKKTNSLRWTVVDLIQTWPLFGTTLFSVQACHSAHATFIRSPCLIGVNQKGLLFLDVDTRVS